MLVKVPGCQIVKHKMCFLVCVWFFLSSVAVQPSAANARDAISGE